MRAHFSEFAVITSYSIHYTKLYDADDIRTGKNIMKAPVRVTITGAAGQIGYQLAFRIASGQMLGPDQPVILRITSYNVCYTKLLRQIHCKCHIIPYNPRH